MLELSPKLRRDLEAGTTVVVPSAQRATALSLAFAADQLERGHRAFRTPPVQALGAWLAQSGAHAAAANFLPRHLPAAEEWLLWREAMNHALRDTDTPDDRLVDPLRRAARLLCDWAIPQAALQASGSRENLLLAATLERFEERLRQLHAVPPHRLLWHLAQRPPAEVATFAGFTEITRARRALIDAWEARGMQSREHLFEFAPGAACVAAAPDVATETLMAAQWCREQLEADPRRRLLVLIPDLSERQAGVSRIFDEFLAPQPFGGTAQAAYAIEGGSDLASYAPVRQALAGWRLLCGELELPELSAWLRAAFWAAPAPAARAALDAWLRRVLRPRTSAAQLLAALTSAPQPLQAAARLIAARVQAARAALAAPMRAPLSTWAGHFEAALAAWESGSRQRSSSEQQLNARLLALLRECAQTTAVPSPLAAGEALELLIRLIKRTRFEPATGDAPVTLSAAITDPVVRYDGIWVTGVTASGFPQAARFNPFIPPSVQRLAGIGAASSSGLIRQARSLLRIWHGCAKELVISWPQRDEHRAHLPSPLLQELKGAVPWHRSAPYIDLARSVRASRRMEEFSDEQGNAWNCARPLPMGARALELQSRCAFRAHAELQLAAIPLEMPRLGISLSERGRMLHRGLELLWQRLEDSAALHAAHAGQRLDALIGAAVEQAAQEVLGEAEPASPPSPPPALASTSASAQPPAPASARAQASAAAPEQGNAGIARLRQAAVARERHRAARLVRALCELELHRPPFKVKALETPRRLQLADAVLDMRIDRIDTLADGTHVIFDYKTGRPLRQDWLEERTQPQLLLYLLAAAMPVSALALVHLTPRLIAYKGLADHAGRVPGLTALAEEAAAPAPEETAASMSEKPAASTPWQVQSGRWQQQLLQLARDFIEGRAGTDPAAGACRVCHLHAFCRIGDLDSEDVEQELHEAQ